MKRPSGLWQKPLPLRRRLVIEKAERFHRLSSDPMEELARVRKRAEKRGVRVLDFTRLSSDIPIPATERSCEEGAISGLIAEKLAESRGLSLDPATEILPIPHIDEAYRLLTLAFINPGDVVLLPDPADPAYRTATVLAGGWPVTVPLLQGTGYLPDLGRIEAEAALRAKTFFFSYPQFPTGAEAPSEFYDELIGFARRHNIILAHDATLAGFRRGGETPAGLLDHPEGREMGIEFHTLAPLHDTEGWRPGFLAGNREILFAVRSLLRLLMPPSGGARFRFYQNALLIDESERVAAAEIYRQRGEHVRNGLAKWGWDVPEQAGERFLWVRVPYRYHSMRFAAMLIRRAGIAVIPGTAFGEFGDESILVSLSASDTSLEVGLDRIGRALPRRLFRRLQRGEASE